MRATCGAPSPIAARTMSVVVASFRSKLVRLIAAPDQDVVSREVPIARSEEALPRVDDLASDFAEFRPVDARSEEISRLWNRCESSLVLSQLSRNSSLRSSPHSEIAPVRGVSKDPPAGPYYDVAPKRTLYHLSASAATRRLSGDHRVTVAVSNAEGIS